MSKLLGKKTKRDEITSPQLQINFAVIGITGSGKNSVLNLICQCGGEYIFLIGEGTDSCTANPQSFTIGPLTLWDFPGMIDVQGRDKEFINTTIRIFKSQKINAIAIVHDIGNIRMKEEERTFIQRLWDMFPSVNVWKNIIFIFTHCDNKQKKKKQKKEKVRIYKEILKEVHKKFHNIFTVVKEIPSFYVYSSRNEEDKTYEEESLEEVKKIYPLISRFPEIKIVSDKIPLKTIKQKGLTRT